MHTCVAALGPLYSKQGKAVGDHLSLPGFQSLNSECAQGTERRDPIFQFLSMPSGRRAAPARHARSVYGKLKIRHTSGQALQV